MISVDELEIGELYEVSGYPRPLILINYIDDDQVFTMHDPRKGKDILAPYQEIEEKIEINSKQCMSCTQYKPYEEFDLNNAGGYSQRCKSCLVKLRGERKNKPVEKTVLSEKITNHLKETGMSKKDLGRRIGGVKSQTINNWQKGTKPTPNTCRKIASYFDVDFDTVQQWIGVSS